jgi:hypothetical protein
MRSQTTKPNPITRLRKIALPVVVLALTASTTNVFGQLTITNIPFAPSWQTNSAGEPDIANDARAITPDGRYIGGLSGTNNGYCYDTVSGYVGRPLCGGYASTITGIGYRNDNGTNELILDGMASGYQANFMTLNGGVTWVGKRRNTSFTAASILPSMNSLGSSATSETYYQTIWNSGKNQIYVNMGSGVGWPSAFAYSLKQVPSPDTSTMNGCSASGRAVGQRTTTSVKNNYMLTWNGTGTPTPANFKALTGDNRGQAFSVSADGNTIFGQSPLTPAGTINYGYKVTLTSTPLTNNATTQASTDALPLMGDETGSSSLQVPYGCTADGNYAVGMDYRGIEHAALWDTSSPFPTKWRVTDLHALAMANGTTDIFVRINRAYSVGTNGSGDPVITGTGTDGSVTRAFLMTVPKWVAAIQFPGNRSAGYGTTVVFQALTNGTDLLTYQWYKNGTPLADGGNVSGATSATLSLTGVSCPGGEAGSYQVVVSNAPISGVVTSGVAVLTVNDPFISVQPASHVCILGSNTTFTVVAAGTPTLTYQWKQNGGILNDGPTGYGSTISGATTDILRIENVTVSDQANYSVDVISSAGCGPAPAVTSAEATLTAMARPILYPYLTSSGGDYTLNFEGPGGQPYKVLYSTNAALSLSRWIPLATGSFSGGPESYTDIAPTNSPRFYILSSP